MKEIIVQKGQSIIDICIEHYGTPQAMLELHQLNNFEMIPQLVQAGDIVKVDPDNSDRVNKQQLRALKGSSIGTYDYTNDGVGQYAIETDLIIA